MDIFHFLWPLRTFSEFKVLLYCVNDISMSLRIGILRIQMSKFEFEFSLEVSYRQMDYFVLYFET